MLTMLLQGKMEESTESASRDMQGSSTFCPTSFAGPARAPRPMLGTLSRGTPRLAYIDACADVRLGEDRQHARQCHLSVTAE